MASKSVERFKHGGTNVTDDRQTDRQRYGEMCRNPSEALALRERSRLIIQNGKTAKRINKNKRDKVYRHTDKTREQKKIIAYNKNISPRF